ncbi:hypothetical protein M407DRAFT_116707 [Tulasnella calospora MUT 4182]|uniref:Uncharacterized protein n=1 Tax=Tulasnella calospora MUT 4182 TaxID=1051891 RepID=A0A0C3KMQ4_9AGAM|nr:hypothetical protein M407DRAFT_116707 [Tulasnella calospora MUT 4182]
MVRYRCTSCDDDTGGRRAMREEGLEEACLRPNSGIRRCCAPLRWNLVASMTGNVYIL